MLLIEKFPCQSQTFKWLKLWVYVDENARWEAFIDRISLLLLWGKNIQYSVYIVQDVLTTFSQSKKYQQNVFNQGFTYNHF